MRTFVRPVEVVRNFALASALCISVVPSFAAVKVSPNAVGGTNPKPGTGKGTSTSKGVEASVWIQAILTVLGM